MVLGIGFLLLVSMALSTALAAFTSHWGEGLGAVAHVLDFVVSFAVITVLFAGIFKYLPDVHIPWSKVWIGAIGTTILFSIGKILLGLYLGKQSTSSAYGAAGSVIVILMWVYYASVILFFGAEFTQVYAKRTGAVIRPSHFAVPVTEEERAQQGLTHTGRLEDLAAEPRQSGRPAAPIQSPGDVLAKDALGVLSLMLTAGFIAGTFLQFKTVRKGLKMYGKIRGTVKSLG